VLSISEWAQDYYRRGWSIVPVNTVKDGICTCGRDDCSTPGKHPCVKWTKYAEARPTMETVKFWFEDEYRDMNIGIITGRVSNLAVVDLDGQLGIDTFRSNHYFGLPTKTLQARTGGGGIHLFYRYPSTALPNKIRAFPGIDVKGDHGFVVAAPSLHKSGNHYRWANYGTETVKGDFTQLCVPEEVEVSSNENHWYLKVLAGVDKGERSNYAAKLSGRYFTAGLALEEVWMIMEAWNSHNDPPLSKHELLSTVRAVQRKNRTNGASADGRELMAMLKILVGKEGTHGPSSAPKA
jgi:Bifunctional DNA primase/polymerase, N-terminal/Primase C terminal 1 (PriCT-1)